MVLGYGVKTLLLNLYNLLPLYGHGYQCYSDWGFLAVSSERVVNSLMQHIQSIWVLVCDFSLFNQCMFSLALLLAWNNFASVKLLGYAGHTFIWWVLFFILVWCTLIKITTVFSQWKGFGRGSWWICEKPLTAVCLLFVLRLLFWA